MTGTILEDKVAYLGKGDEFIYNHPRLLQLIDDIIDCIMNDKRPDIYFAVTMKDEQNPLQWLW